MLVAFDGKRVITTCRMTKVQKAELPAPLTRVLPSEHTRMCVADARRYIDFSFDVLPVGVRADGPKLACCTLKTGGKSCLMETSATHWELSTLTIYMGNASLGTYKGCVRKLPQNEVLQT